MVARQASKVWHLLGVSVTADNCLYDLVAWSGTVSKEILLAEFVQGQWSVWSTWALRTIESTAEKVF